MKKEQFLSLGWKEMNPPISTFTKEFLDIPFEKNNFRLDYNYRNFSILITSLAKEIFYGECKSIEDLKEIMIKLNID